MEHDIFLSYARENEVRAGELAGALEQRGYAVFWDRRVPPGKTWHSYIGGALAAAKCIVVAWSQHSISSQWVIEEANEGKERDVLIPVLFEPIAPPFGFRAIQAANLIDWQPNRPSHAFEDLLIAIEGIVETPSAPARKTRKTSRTAKPKAAQARPRTEPADRAMIRDGDFAPELVMLPQGEFLMGSPDNDQEAEDAEKPQHRVRIDYRVAMGRYPVTFEEYDHFCEQTGRERPEDRGGWGRGRRPVINVSWEGATAYYQWLSGVTGQSYRLPSEAEWEYACRARTTTRYAFGDEITTEQANFDQNVDKTVEVGSYSANAWGLYDMHGNVWEWLEDCWNETYEGAPDDGSARTSGDCRRRVVRGGSWVSNPRRLRSACRDGDGSDGRYFYSGFRVARTLP